MKNYLFLSLLLVGTACAQETIAAYITPYYYVNDGPVISIGDYSQGLASAKPKIFEATIRKMQGDWANLTFIELFTGSIRLYNLGYRKEAVRWYLTAEYRSNLFKEMLDRTPAAQKKDTKSRGLLSAREQFITVLDPYFSSYAGTDIDGWIKILQTLQEEGKALPDLQKIYPDSVFVPRENWPALNAALLERYNETMALLRTQKEEVSPNPAYVKLASKELAPVGK